MQIRQWHARSSERLPDGVWRATVRRVRGEFDEIPSLRVTLAEARILFGLTDTTSDWILKRLTMEGFLVRTSDGQYARRATRP